MTGDSSSMLGEKRSNDLSVIALDQQIADHKKADGSRSVLGWAVSQIWRSDEGSLARLEKLSKDVKEAQAKGDTATVSALQKDISSAITSDQDAVGLQGEISHYGGGALKTAALFFGGGKGGLLSNRGMIGLATTVGLYGLDEAKMNDDAGSFAANFALGGAKGGLTKGMFQAMGSLPIESPALKGITMGFGSRIIDTSLTASNYKDGDGNFSLAQGLGKTFHSATDTRAMVIDAALFSAAHGLTKGANWMTNGAVEARPVYNTIATSASFGLSGGAWTELSRQMATGEQIDYGKIAMRALLQGGVDAIAGVPGGINADPQFRQRPWETLKEDGAAIASKFSFLKEKGIQQAKADMFGSEQTQPQQRRAVQAATDGRGDTTGSGGEERLVLGAVEKTADELRHTESKKLKSTGGDGEKTETTGEKKVAPEREYTPEEIRKATAELDARITQLTGREPTRDQTRDLIKYLTDHPEGDAHAATLYVRKFSDPAVRRAIEAFYKPSFAMDNERALATDPVREAYDRFDAAMREDANRSVLPHILGGYIKNMIRRAGDNGAPLREVIEHHARTTYDTVAAKAVDSALGTDYAKEIEGHGQADRTMPLTDKDIEYVRALALGKPLPGGPTRIANLEGTDAAAKLLGVEPERLVAGEGPERTVVNAMVGDVVAEAQRGLAETIAKDAIIMRTGTQAEKIDAANKLADHLGHDTAGDWFKTWTELAPMTHVSAAGELANPDVKVLIDRNPEAVRQFLSSDPGSVAMSFRIRTLSELATTFRDKPFVAEEILKIGGGDPTTMRSISYELTRGFARQQYAQWLEAQVTPKDGHIQPTLDQISGDAAVRKARIFTAYGDTPVGKYLEQFAELQPESAQKLLQKLPRPEGDQPQKDAGRGGPPRPPRGADLQNLIQEVVERRIQAGIGPEALPEQLNPDLLQMEIRLGNAFKKNPQALDSLLSFARTHLPEVTALLQMPLTPEAQRVAAQRPPRGRPDRNDPQVQAQQALKKLTMAYSDLVGMMAPKAAELGPEQGLQQLQMIQDAFSDVIIKNFAANLNPNQPIMRQNAELAERELNRLTDQYLPDHEVARRDAQLRREAIAKQDANLLPQGPPPDIAKLMEQQPRTTTTATDPAPELDRVVVPPADEKVVVQPVREEPVVQPVREEPVVQPVVEETPVQPPVQQPKDTARPKPRVFRSFQDLVADNMAADETVKQEQWQQRKGRNNGYEDGEEGDMRPKKGAKGKRGGYGSPKDWRRANRGEADDEY